MSFRPQIVSQSSPTQATLDRFGKIVGEKYALTGDLMKPFLREPRDLYEGRAALVLKPGSAEEVSAILKLAQETRDREAEARSRIEQREAQERAQLEALKRKYGP